MAAFFAIATLRPISQQDVPVSERLFTLHECFGNNRQIIHGDALDYIDYKLSHQHSFDGTVK